MSRIGDAFKALTKSSGPRASREMMLLKANRETWIEKQVQEYNALNAVITDRLGAAVPPWDPYVLLAYLDSNAYLNRGNRWKVAATVGPGFDCTPALLEHLRMASKRKTFKQFLKSWALDVENYGYAFHETQRGAYTVNFYNLASIKTRLKPFLDGTHKFIHYEYGLGLLYWQEYDEFTQNAREGVSMFNQPTIRGHLYYGDPEWISAKQSLESNVNIGQVGLKYFENSLISDMAITLKGTELDPDEREKIRAYLSSTMKGVDNAHKILFFEVGPNEDVVFNNLNMKFDDSLLNTRKANTEEIMTANGLPPILLGWAQAGRLGGVAEVEGQIKIFKLGFTDDRQDDYTTYWQNRLDEAGLPDAESFVLHPMEIDTDAADLAALTTAAGAPIMTPAQAQQEWQNSKSATGMTGSIIHHVFKDENHFIDALNKAGKLADPSDKIIGDLREMRKLLEEENGA